MWIEIVEQVSQLHYKIEKFCISGFRISRIAIGFTCSGNTPTNFRSLGLIPDIFFGGSPRYLPLERNKTDRAFLLYLPVARYCDIGVAARLQAHPSYSAETLPLEEECMTGPGYKNVIVLQRTRALLSTENERALARSGDRNAGERLPSRTWRTLPARAFYTRTPRFPGTSRRRRNR